MTLATSILDVAATHDLAVDDLSTLDVDFDSLRHNPFVHPDIDVVPGIRSAIGPRRPLWTPDELAGLSSTIAELAAPQLRALARHDPDRRWWARLALTDEVEVWLLGWAPRQGTRWHGHGGAHGAFTLLDGTVRERYQDGDQPRRTDHLSAPSTSRFDQTRFHSVFNPTAANATSVHAYSPALLPLDEDGAP